MLAREVLDSDVRSGAPTPASGLTQDQWEGMSSDEQSTGIVWLLEPERSSIIQRWSGTMQHPKQTTNKTGATVTAFAHFAYIFSLRTIVFADIQSKWGYQCLHSMLTTILGSPGKLAHSHERGTILFDVMTHTNEGCVCIPSVSEVY